MKSFIALSSLLAVAFAAHPAPAPYHPTPAYKPAPYHPAPSYKEDPAVYQYQYGVSDEYAGLNFGADEARDGYSTQGKYSVALPDGRIQTVTYNVADAYSGYVADVTYSERPNTSHTTLLQLLTSPLPSTTLPQLPTSLLLSTTLPQLPTSLPLSTSKLQFTTLNLHSSINICSLINLFMLNKYIKNLFDLLSH
ncbi:uncharacterized protein [Lepeophtheirus salmonis]|uniref:uncharacterized protein n=1 Tax=Lepeophtheirus salmonis TaxID=72036 RepID=UPI001AE29879|nr:uncharacterized protein LOC121122793 [Lepeophtheirus salmonis]